MLTKVLAAKRAARSGAQTVIASGHEPDVLVRIGRRRSRRHPAHRADDATRARKQWLADHLQSQERSAIDAGAAKALRSGGKSLLPIGVKSVAGEFERGAVVACSHRRAPRSRVDWSTITRRNPGASPPGVKRDRGDTRIHRRPELSTATISSCCSRRDRLRQIFHERIAHPRRRVERGGIAGMIDPNVKPALFLSAWAVASSNSKRRKCTREVFARFSRRDPRRQSPRPARGRSLGATLVLDSDQLREPLRALLRIRVLDHHGCLEIAAVRHEGVCKQRVPR